MAKVKKKFYKTKVTVTVISAYSPIEFDDLEILHNMITDGDCVGDYKVESEKITSAQAAEDIVAMNSDPEFFNIDEEGKPTDGEDEDGDIEPEEPGDK